jgi:hypothetical protein
MSEGGPDRTLLAVILTIVMVLVASIPAALVVIIYSYLSWFWFRGDSWVPYLDEVGRLWFPELLRGLTTGVIAIWPTQRFVKNYNEQAVKLATVTFWAAILILLTLMDLSMRGFSLDIVASIALLVGLWIGLSLSRDSS